MRFRHILFFMLCGLAFVACDKDPKEVIVSPPIPEQEQGEELTEVMVADVFAIGALQNYYLWIDDAGRLDKVKKTLDAYTCTDPVKAVKEVLHEDDRWTMLTDNISPLMDYTDGIETTDGIDLTPYRFGGESDRVFFIVNFVYTNSPAADAGVKRGDIFIKYNGQYLTIDNYRDYFNNDKPFTFGCGRITENRVVEATDVVYSLTPVKMYEEPLIATKVFEIDGKKVGYIAYASFTEDVENLKTACESLKEEGVTELVLDLRYNGGGYVSTCDAFASMLAPEKNVNDEDVFIKNVYNKLLTEKVFNKRLDNKFIKKYASSNLDLKKIYALVSKGTASASEMLLVGLMPYVDVTILGEATHGKFCSGVMLTPEDIFTEAAVKEYGSLFGDWGIYVMVGSFANSLGENPCRPAGIIPAYEVEDNPFDGYLIGDENETMLRAALELAGKQYPAAAPTRSVSTLPYCNIGVERPSFAIQKLSSNLKL